MAELFPDLKRPLIVAHRGGSTGIPNTLDAFRHLIASGGEAVEFDVRRTVDGVLVVHHGPNAAGLRLARLTYDEFCRYTHQHQPTLDEAIELCGSRLHLNVEIKARGYEQAVLECLNARVARSHYMISSYSATVLAKCRSLDPGITTGLIVVASARPVIFPVARAQKCKADVLVLNHRIAQPLLTRRAAQHGLQVLLWTVNTPRGVSHAFGDPNVAGIITDYPHRAERIRRLVRQIAISGRGGQETGTSHVLN